MDNHKITNKLCNCGQPNRPGQRTCQACHSAYMAVWRERNRVVLDADQKRIVKAVLEDEQYEPVMAVVGATIGHHVYDYVKVQKLIDIIKVLARRSHTK